MRQLLLFCIALLTFPAFSTSLPCRDLSTVHCQQNVSNTTSQTVVVYLQTQAQQTPIHPFVPYHGIIDRTPYLTWIVIICSTLLPIGMLLVTALTVFEYVKDRKAT